jgi:hypothetical protein
MTMRPDPEFSSYSEKSSTVDGRSVQTFRFYRRHSFAASNESPKTYFSEEIFTVDADGSFLAVETRSGTTNPEQVTETVKRTYEYRAKIRPIKAPIR